MSVKEDAENGYWQVTCLKLHSHKVIYHYPTLCYFSTSTETVKILRTQIYVVIVVVSKFQNWEQKVLSTWKECTNEFT